MGRFNRVVLSITFVSLSGCAHSAIVPFERNPESRSYAATDVNTVGVFKSTAPFSPFEELGLISFRAGTYDLPLLYEQIRRDAAEYGAQAVVGVKVTGETHSELVSEEHCQPKTECDANGICSTENECHTEQVPTDVSSFLITGTMIREKK